MGTKYEVFKKMGIKGSAQEIVCLFSTLRRQMVVMNLGMMNTVVRSMARSKGVTSILIYMYIWYC